VNDLAWAGDKDAVAVFRFHNEGTSPVAIISARSSCGCTKVLLPAKTFAAGANGELRAVFEIGEMVGQQTKLITVVSDDAPSKPTILVLGVNIQQFATINPTFVYWRVGDAVSPKRIEIVARASQTISAIEATSSNIGIAARIETIDSERQFVLWLTPSSTAKALSATVVCKAQINSKSRQLVAVHALVVK
jgi:hypothetical protein